MCLGLNIWFMEHVVIRWVQEGRPELVRLVTMVGIQEVSLRGGFRLQVEERGTEGDLDSKLTRSYEELEID